MMLKKTVFKLFLVFQVIFLVALAIGTSAPTPAHAAAVKIMPLGDSITGSPGCWRALLWARLQAAGYTNIDFVGTQPAQGCSVPYDGDSEGRGGLLATGAADPANLPVWLAANVPDIVMMHLGTNDVWSTTRSTSVILNAYTTMVGQMRAANPNVKILVAQILPMNPSGCATCSQGAIDLDAAIPAWASGLTTSQSPIIVVDQWTGFNTATDTGDGVHPNDAGNQKISDKWYPALSALLTPTGPTLTKTPTSLVSNTPSRTPTRTNTPTVTNTPVFTNTVTRTSTVTNTPLVSNTPTRTPTRTNTALTPTRTVTPSITPTLGTGTACSPVSSTITVPFTFDGAGIFCWQASSLGSYVNSWNTTSVTINGVNETNLYVASGSYPAKVSGFYYVSYNSSVAWGHFEAK